MSNVTFIDISDLNEIEGQLAYTQNQLEMALIEIERLSERIREYEKNDKAKQGSE